MASRCARSATGHRWSTSTYFQLLPPHQEAFRRAADALLLVADPHPRAGHHRLLHPARHLAAPGFAVGGATALVLLCNVVRISRVVVDGLRVRRPGSGVLPRLGRHILRPRLHDGRLLPDALSPAPQPRRHRSRALHESATCSKGARQIHPNGAHEHLRAAAGQTSGAADCRADPRAGRARCRRGLAPRPRAAGAQRHLRRPARTRTRPSAAWPCSRPAEMGLASTAPSLLRAVRAETDPAVLAAVVRAVAARQWEPASTGGIVELRLWARAYAEKHPELRRASHHVTAAARRCRGRAAALARPVPSQRVPDQAGPGARPAARR